MNMYATEPLGFWQLLQRCFAVYPQIFKKIWYLLAAALLLAVIPVVVVFSNAYIGIALLILTLLLLIFIMAIMLYVSNDALLEKASDLLGAIKIQRKRYLFLLGGILLLLAIMVLAITIDFGIFALGDWLGLHIGSFVIVFVFSAFVALLFYFALPLIVLENKGILKSFEKSANLFLVNGWRIVGIFIIIHLLTFIVSSFGVFFLHLPDGTYWYVVYSFLLQFLIYPLIISTILILMHDASLRLKRVK